MPAITRGKQYKQKVQAKRREQYKLTAKYVNAVIGVYDILKRCKRAEADVDYAYRNSREYARVNGIKHAQTVIDSVDGHTVYATGNGVKQAKCCEHHYSTRVLHKWEQDALNAVNPNGTIETHCKWSKREVCVIYHDGAVNAVKALITRHDIGGDKYMTARIDGIDGELYIEPCLSELNDDTLSQIALKQAVNVYKVVGAVND